jgi:ACS family D-galactonate transporter-like MFS transporter
MVSDGGRDTAGRPTRARYLIAVLLFVSVVINYLDRANLSVAAPQLAKDLGFDDAQKGYILAAFGWTYAALQVPGGWLVDKIPPRILYPVAIALWSLATIGLGFVGSVAGLIGLRLLVGGLEAPSYPINSRVVTTWFPERERATAVGFYTSGQFVGLAFLSPVLYALPQDFRAANAAEVALIREGGGCVDLATTNQARAAFQWNDLATVLVHRKLWGLYLGQFCLTSTLWFFLTWFPTYLVDFRGLDFIKAGMLGSVPFLAAFAGVNCSGILSDRLLRAGWSLGFSRKLPIITGLLISASIVGANYVESPALVIAFLSLAFFGNGLASITWSLVSAIAPERLIGLTGGMFNFVGNLASVGVPIVIGYLVKGGDFAPAITFIALTAMAGAVCYGLVVGKVERITIEAGAKPPCF